MGAKVNSSVKIDRPVEDVFSYVLDLEANGPEWAPDLESVEKVTEGPVGAGTTFRQVQTMMGKRRTTSLTFTAVDPGRQISAEAKLGPISPVATLTFEGANGGTEVTISAEGNPRGLFKLLTPVFARAGQRLWDARLAQLKNVMESSS